MKLKLSIFYKRRVNICEIIQDKSKKREHMTAGAPRRSRTPPDIHGTAFSLKFLNVKRPSSALHSSSLRRCRRYMVDRPWFNSVSSWQQMWWWVLLARESKGRDMSIGKEEEYDQSGHVPVFAVPLASFRKYRLRLPSSSASVLLPP